MLPLLWGEVLIYTAGNEEWRKRVDEVSQGSLNEVLLLFLCMRVVTICIDDGCVCVGGVVCSFGLVRQIRSCHGRNKRDDSDKTTIEICYLIVVSVSQGIHSKHFFYIEGMYRPDQPPSPPL